LKYTREKGDELKKPKLPDYSMWIASEGQTSTQVWQSTHISLSIFALSFSMAIADAGHSLTQVSHPVHLSLSTTATNSFTPTNMFLFIGKKRVTIQHGTGLLMAATTGIIDRKLTGIREPINDRKNGVIR
jgi:hypothetical protein